MQCNKNPNYQLKENEAGNYHLLITYRIKVPHEKRFEEHKHKVIVSPKDFQQYKKSETQKAIGWSELEILHDPTIKIKETKPVEKPEVKTEVKTDEPEVKVDSEVKPEPTKQIRHIKPRKK